LLVSRISLLSQASWGRLQMKPKRNKGHGLGTLIASLQVLLSKAISLEILQSLRSLLTNSSQVSLCLPLPLFTLSTRSRTPLRNSASGGLRWTCSNHLNRRWVLKKCNKRDKFLFNQKDHDFKRSHILKNQQVKINYSYHFSLPKLEPMQTNFI